MQENKDDEYIRNVRELFNRHGNFIAQLSTLIVSLMQYPEIQQNKSIKEAGEKLTQLSNAIIQIVSSGTPNLDAAIAANVVLPSHGNETLRECLSHTEETIITALDAFSLRQPDQIPEDIRKHQPTIARLAPEAAVVVQFIETHEWPRDPNRRIGPSSGECNKGPSPN